jgi:hypothetical protein
MPQPRGAKAVSICTMGNERCMDFPYQRLRKYEHYCTLAQATNAGDAVTREQHWQNAEHFLRLINGSATQLFAHGGRMARNRDQRCAMVPQQNANDSVALT